VVEILTLDVIWLEKHLKSSKSVCCRPSYWMDILSNLANCLF